MPGGNFAGPLELSQIPLYEAFHGRDQYFGKGEEKGGSLRVFIPLLAEKRLREFEEPLISTIQIKERIGLAILKTRFPADSRLPLDSRGNPVHPAGNRPR